jgi:hypothetical protein
VSYIYYNEIHEAGHAVLALCYKCDVTRIYINEKLLFTATWAFDPAKTPPCIPYAIQLAGSIAVQIQNEKIGRSDEDGFGGADEPGSDANRVSSVRAYLGRMGMSDTSLDALDADIRRIVRHTPLRHWVVVQAIAREAASIIPLTPSIQPASNMAQLSASRLGKVIQTADMTFYESVKDYLRSSG